MLNRREFVKSTAGGLAVLACPFSTSQAKPIHATLTNRQERYKKYRTLLPKHEATIDKLVEKVKDLCKSPSKSIWGKQTSTELRSHITNLLVYGDHFVLLMYDRKNCRDGITNLFPLLPDTMYRIKTTRGQLVEFQQSQIGYPDYKAVAEKPLGKKKEWYDGSVSQETMQPVVRFRSDEIVHFRLANNIVGFRPYGVSVIEDIEDGVDVLSEDYVIAKQLDVEDGILEIDVHDFNRRCGFYNDEPIPLPIHYLT